jgi:hypothetical protein
VGPEVGDDVTGPEARSQAELLAQFGLPMLGTEDAQAAVIKMHGDR